MNDSAFVKTVQRILRFVIKSAKEVLGYGSYNQLAGKSLR
jgi:hypothetical protein